MVDVHVVLATLFRMHFRRKGVLLMCERCTGGHDRNGRFVSRNTIVRMWVGTDNHERTGSVIHVTPDDTIIRDAADNCLFSRPTSQVELMEESSRL